jgi:hypothetical protein
MGQDVDKELAANIRTAKTKSMQFAFVVKGSSDGALVLDKSKISPDEIVAAKKKCGGSQVVRGTCVGVDGQLMFETDGDPPGTMAAALKKVIQRDAGITQNCACRPAGTAPAPAAEQNPNDKAKQRFTQAMSRAAPQIKTSSALDKSGKLKTKVAMATQLGKNNEFDKATAAIEDAGKFAVAIQRYPETMKLLTPRFKTALPLDQDGQLKAKINTAQQLAGAGSFIEAFDTLDDAGQTASALISAGPKKKQVSDPNADPQLVGKKLPDKYKNEQYQTNEHGQVMHGGEFRGASKVRTKYYNEEEKEKSVIHTDDRGRLVDSEGNLLDTGAVKRGYVVSQETGTAHQFNPNKIEPKGQYVLGEHHSSPIQGGAAAAAGELKADSGVVREVTDESGHFRPNPEMTHQFVQSMEEQGVAMREKKLSMLDDDGNPTDISPEMAALLDEVNEYEDTRDTTQPYDPEMFKKAQRLRDAGVSFSNRQAQVDLTNPKTFVSAEEFAPIQGNGKAIAQLVRKKIGKNPDLGHYRGNWTTLESVNDWIGVLSRIKAVDPKTTRLQMTTEQFSQTGGNVDAIRGKEAVNKEIESRRAPDDDAAETERMQKLVERLGGDAKLRQLGVQDPASLSVEGKFRLLSKAGAKPPTGRPSEDAEEEQEESQGDDDAGDVEEDSDTEDEQKEVQGEDAKAGVNQGQDPLRQDNADPMAHYNTADPMAHYNAFVNPDSQDDDAFDVEEDSDTEDEAEEEQDAQDEDDGGPGDDRLNLKRKKRAPKQDPRQAEYDNLGGDQALLEKLLPTWKTRNKSDLAKLLDLNKRVKQPDGSDDQNLAKERKSLVDKIGKSDPMPTTSLLGKWSLEDRLEKLQAN